jgi:hypothetical protein
MRKIVIGLCILGIVLVCSCSKSSSSKSNTWSFKGNSSKAYACLLTQFYAAPQFNGNYGLAAPTTASSRDSNYAFMAVIFPDTTGVVAGNYTVIADDGVHAPTGSQVMVHLRYGPQTNPVIYYATGVGNGQKVSVSFTPTGHVSVSGTDIEMQNQGPASTSDKSNLTFYLTAQ